MCKTVVRFALPFFFFFLAWHTCYCNNRAATQGFLLHWNGEFSSVCWFAVHILHGRLLIKKRTEQISVLLYEWTRKKHNSYLSLVISQPVRLFQGDTLISKQTQLVE